MESYVLGNRDALHRWGEWQKHLLGNREGALLLLPNFGGRLEKYSQERLAGRPPYPHITFEVISQILSLVSPSCLPKRCSSITFRIFDGECRRCAVIEASYLR